MSNKFDLVGLKKDLVDRLCSIPGLVSMTPTGSYATKTDVQERVVDLDYVLVCEEVTPEVVETLESVGNALREKYSLAGTSLQTSVRGAHLGGGPVKPDATQDLNIVLDFRVYSPDTYRSSKMTRISWQRFDPVIGVPLRSIYEVTELSYDDILRDHDNPRAVAFWLQRGISKHSMRPGRKHVLSDEELTEMAMYYTITTASNMARVIDISSEFGTQRGMDKFEQFFMHHIPLWYLPRQMLHMKKKLKRCEPLTQTDAIDLRSYRTNAMWFLQQCDKYMRTQVEPVKTKWFFDISPCPMACTFCFSDWRDYSAKMSTQDVVACLRRLYDNGVDAVSFSGGEPLLRPDIEELLVGAKNLGMRTTLCTTGIGLEGRLPKLAPLIDTLGLPLDSTDQEVHNALRPSAQEKDHYGLVLRIMRDVAEHYPELHLSISTIVSRQNEASVAGIGGLIPSPSTWVLNQFRRSGFGEKHVHQHEIDDATFEKIAAECTSRYTHLRKVYAFGRNYDTGCRVINPEKRVLMTTDHGLKDLGNFFEIPPDQFKLIYRGG